MGQGTYGCIFDPPLLCERKQRSKSNRIGKLTDKEDADEERLASIAIKKMPNWSDYFIIADLDSFCRPKDIKQQKEEDILSCDVIRKVGFEGMIQFEMPLGGIDLYNTLRSANLSAEKLKVFDLIEHILEAGAIMVLSGFCHYDIHPGNILIDKAMTPKFIDFGDSFTEDEISSKLIVLRRKEYKPSFATEPPEILTFSGIRHDKTLDACLMEMVSVKPPVIMAERLLGLSRNRQAARFRRFWGTSRAVRKNDMVSFWKTYWPMFDSWSIASVLIDMMNRLIRISTFDSQRMSVLKNTLQTMLQMNPRDRFDCVEALNMFDPMNKILQRPAAKKWLEKRREERGHDSL